MVQRVERAMLELVRSYDHVSYIYSHWTETIGWMFDETGKVNFSAVMSKLYDMNGPREESNEYFSIRKVRINDSFQVVNRKLLETWFSRYHFQEDLRRTDCAVQDPEHVTVVPHKEIVRHFDAYSHIGVDINDVHHYLFQKDFLKRKLK